jgi:hypothetical protein
MLSTVNLSVEKQLDDKWAAAFYECGVSFEVANSEAFRDAVEDTARLVPDDIYVCTGSDGFGCKEGRCKAATRTHSGTDSVAMSSRYNADTRKQISVKDALHLLPKLGKTGTLVSTCSCLMGAGAAPSSRCGICGICRCLSHRNLRHLPLEKDTDTWWGDWARARRCYTISELSRCSCHKPADPYRRCRATLEGVCAHPLSKAPWAGAGSETAPSAL